MLNRLIAVRVIPHVHHLHLADLVYNATVIALIEDGREDKDRVEHAVKRFLPTHQVDQSLHVMEDRPGIMPAVPLGERVSPFERVKGGLEGSILVTSTHQSRLFIEEVAIILAPLRVQIHLRIGSV